MWNDTSCMDREVPTLAPKTGAMACSRVMTPALMKPASIATAAPEWARKPTVVPKTAPWGRLRVARARMERRDVPAAARRLPVMTCMP